MRRLLPPGVDANAASAGARLPVRRAFFVMARLMEDADEWSGLFSEWLGFIGRRFVLFNRLEGSSMKRFVMPLVGAALLAGAFLSCWSAVPAAAAEKKPLVVMALAGYDRIRSDIAYVGQISDNPGLDVNLEAVLKLFTRGQGLAGVDKFRPWGAVLFAEESGQPSGFGFIPVSDAAKLFEVLAPLVGQGEDAGGGVKKFGRGPRAMFVKQHEQWLLLSNKPESLNDVSGDPSRWLGDLTKEYDAAVRVFAAHMPPQWRQRAEEAIRRGVERELRRRGHETDIEHQIRTEIFESIATVARAVVNDVEALTVGWNLDGTKERATFDVRLTARPGSELARETVAALENLKTGFAGFILPDAVLSGNWGGRIPEFKATVLDSVLTKARTQVLEDLEKSNRGDEEKEVLKSLIEDISSVVIESVKSRQVDGALSVSLKPDASVMVVAGRLADAGRLDKVLRTISSAVDRVQPGALEWASYEKESWRDLTLHSVALPIEETGRDAENMIRLFGEKINIVVGVGKESLVMAVGANAKQTLKQAVEKSGEAAQAVNPMKITLSLKPLADLIAEYGEEKDRPQAAAVARVLADQQGNDKISLTASAIPDGVQWRVEIDSGVLRLIGKMAQEAQTRR